jgi:hypothetical protein
MMRVSRIRRRSVGQQGVEQPGVGQPGVGRLDVRRPGVAAAIAVVAALSAACTTHQVRCHGALQPINKPLAAPLGKPTAPPSGDPKAAREPRP